MNDLKTFEFHRFVEGILHTQTYEAFLITDETMFAQNPPHFPYRNYFYGIGLIEEGERTLRVGIEDYHLKAKDLLVIGPGIIRQWLDTNWMVKQKAIFFTPSLFESPINPHFLTDSFIFHLGIKHVISLNDTDYHFFSQLFESMGKNQYPKLIAALTLSMIEKIELLHLENKKTGHKSSRKQQITKQFCSLINKHYLESKEVSFYADKLNITPKYLSEVIKEETGKAPKNLIEQLLMQEAKSLLKQTQMSIKEISYWLGFDDPSYFTKAFRVAEGITPNEYRNI
jgi:AraC family transcriptional regulator, transcriptional activator of pobA